MPRQIIDTESSRPAYQRRLAVRWVIIVLVIVIALLAGFEFWKAGGHHAANLGLLSPDRTLMDTHRRTYAA
jgi:hypothetical protein